jgi:hypothetical protein
LLRVAPAELASWDQAMAAALPRSALEQAVDAVPDDFLLPLLPAHAGGSELRREREAYVAFLWKRLKPPRPFVPVP